MIFTPEMNDGRHVFVFGSNEAGIHGAGAAKTAMKYWGARWGAGFGRTGNAYAIPTKNGGMRALPLPAVKIYAHYFLAEAREYDDLTFLVTAIGCGLAGYRHEQIAPMFKGAPANCVMPEEWREWL